MSQNWSSVFSGVIGSTLFYKDVLREKQMSIQKFGDGYKLYMKKVPTLMFFLGFFFAISSLLSFEV
jgi:protein-S-isoprenylcysteine O-methyltransferase Ste14